MELLPNGLIFLGDACELLGYPTQLMRNGDKPLTSWDRRATVVDSAGIVLASVSALKSRWSRGLRRRALLAWASCSAMKANG